MRMVVITTVIRQKCVEVFLIIDSEFFNDSVYWFGTGKI